MAEEMYGQKALLRNIAEQNARLEAKAKAEQQQREAERSKIEESRRKRAEFREWATVVFSFIGTILSIISLLWQAPLH